MRRLSVFENLSLDGHFTDAKGDMSWAHAGGDDPEFQAYTVGNVQGEGEIVMGRVTFEMMAAFWPSEAATQMMPEVARKMNESTKHVFSRTLSASSWSRCQFHSQEPAAVMRELKQLDGPDMVVLGSGSIVAQLVAADLVDSMSLVVCPVAIGAGRSLFEGLPALKRFQLQSSRSFANGKTVLNYGAG